LKMPNSIARSFAFAVCRNRGRDNTRASSSSVFSSG
jgi:hypothetical protein